MKDRLGITPDEIEGSHAIALSRPRELPIDSLVTVPDMRSGVWFPLFEELANPRVVNTWGGGGGVRLARSFRVGSHPLARADKTSGGSLEHWITLAAIASATEEIMLGPMVTPLARRRPEKVAPETATLDRFCDGRLILGVGLGGDRFGAEFSKTGDQVDDRLRGEMLDEALEILAVAWSGEPENHHGKPYLVDDVRFLPRPVQEGGIPVWAAAFPGHTNRCPGRHVANGFFRSASKAWINSRKP